MKKTILLRNDLSEITLMKDSVESFCEQASLPEEFVQEVKLVLEEVVSNTIQYGFEANSDQQVRINLSLAGNDLLIEVRDNGSPFNPLDASDPDLEQPFEDRDIGGLGILLLKQMFKDGLAYRREKGFNVLTIKKTLPENPDSLHGAQP